MFQQYIGMGVQFIVFWKVVLSGGKFYGFFIKVYQVEVKFCKDGLFGAYLKKDLFIFFDVVYVQYLLEVF